MRRSLLSAGGKALVLLSPCILADGALRKPSCLLKVDCFPLKSAGSNSKPFNCVVSMKWCVRYFLSLQSFYPSYLEWLPLSFSFAFFIHSFIHLQTFVERESHEFVVRAMGSAGSLPALKAQPSHCLGA